MRKPTVLLFLLPVLSSACRGHAPAAPAGFDIERLAADYWELRLAQDPIEATTVGERRFDTELPDPRPEARRAHERKLRTLRERIAAIDPWQLSAHDRVTLAQLLTEIDSDLAALACDLDSWTVDPMGGPHVRLLNLVDVQVVSTPASGRALLARWHKIPAYLDAVAENLRRSKEESKIAPREAVVRVIRQLEDLLATRTEDWPLSRPARVARPDWPPEEAAAFVRALDRVVALEIEPAFRRLRDLLREKILPAARAQEHVGLLHVSGGAACYTALIKMHTTLDFSAAEIHEFGRQEIARIGAELAALGERFYGVRDLAELRQKLSEPAAFFRSRDEVEQAARGALARASAALLRMVQRVPQTPCEVRRIEPHEERDAPIAYYRQPALDGSRPGAYFVNTYAPETRPRWEAEVLAFHEAIPGHHLQIARAQETASLPAFRRQLGATAFVEGWALYAERLADELGLYSSEQDRLGMLSFDAWRAGRLVVDTGLHALGWSRQAAVEYLRAHTLLTEANIENEVDRYIVWPGQALAYKMGQRELLALRALARARLGARFDLAAFHDAILSHGALSLPILRGEVERWLVRQSLELGR